MTEPVEHVGLTQFPLDYEPRNEAELLVCLQDPMWRICSGYLYQIMVKDTSSETGAASIPFKPNLAQMEFIDRLWHRNIILKARQLGFCVDPSTRVLTADLRWVAIRDLTVGQRLVAVDEHVPGGKGAARKMRTADVQAVQVVRRMAYRITLDDGRQVVCTDQHPWLTRKAATDAKWRSISGRGNAVVGRIKVGTRIRWVTKPWQDGSYEDGWFGGVLDGEGSMAQPHSSGAELNVSQVQGAVFERMKAYLRNRGYAYRIEADACDREGKLGSRPVDKLCVSRMDELFRLVGQTRPARFIGRPFWEGKELPGKRNGGIGWATVTRIEQMGEQDMIDLQTSTGTYIAEGFVSHNTTLTCIIWLDHALFNRDQRCGVVAHDRESAETIFRDKVLHAYERLPPALKAEMPTKGLNKSEIIFGHNNSSVRVATSMRSGTIHRLLVSEFGKVCARFPDKAKEIVTGSLPAVPQRGITIIESTAEGKAGYFYEMTKKSEELHQAKKQLTVRDYRFNFFAWHENPEYELNPRGVAISPKDHEYFFKIEGKIGRKIGPRKRAWYVATRESEFGGDPALMWREYPSTPDEAFQQSMEGVYYARELAVARAQGRIGKVPFVSGVPVHTFWDIGARDGTGIWLMQKVGAEHRLPLYIEAWGEPYAYFIRELQALGLVWGKHYLPHDADHKRQQGHRIASPREMLEELTPGWSWEVVPPVQQIQHGIQAVRNMFGSLWFDEEGCKEGLAHLGSYSKQWDSRAAVWKDEPLHDIHSEAADALRQMAQGWFTPSGGHGEHSVRAGMVPNRRIRGGMVV